MCNLHNKSDKMQNKSNKTIAQKQLSTYMYMYTYSEIELGHVSPTLLQ